MSAHLTPQQIDDVQNAIIDANFDYNAIRPVLLAGISPHFRSLLPGGIGMAPFAQLALDLNMLNSVERLADGSVPLKVWLANAVSLLRPYVQGKVLAKMLDMIESDTTGAPPIDTANLPETKEAIVHQDDMVTQAFMELGVSTGASVARLQVRRHENGQLRLLNNNPMIYLGTGWLLSESLIITNHHVLNARGDKEPDASQTDLLLQGSTATVRFDFNDDALQGVEVASSAMVAWDKQLDYAVLRIPPTGRKAVPRNPQPVTKAEDDYKPLNIIQHPEGTCKKYAIRNNLLTAATDTEIRYFTDTKQGSSGSPVLDDSWLAVGLHRASTAAHNVKFQGKSVAWVNIGTQVTAILAHLSVNFPGIAAEIV